MSLREEGIKDLNDDGLIWFLVMLCFVWICICSFSSLYSFLLKIILTFYTLFVLFYIFILFVFNFNFIVLSFAFY